MKISAAVAALALGACASGDSSSVDRADRSTTVVEACREHGGVTAFDDDAVICRDQTYVEERGERAVEACREHGGDSAYDDDIVMCRDQSFHEAEGG
jgi:hypothetical protein